MRCCILTLGCKVNQYESDAMRGILQEAGCEVVDDPKDADVCIVNTCTVTNIADRKSRQSLSKVHRLNPAAKLIAVGCWAQRNPEAALNFSGVSAVIGTGWKSRIAEVVSAVFRNGTVDSADSAQNADMAFVCDVMHEHHFDELSAAVESRTRAYLKIQDGCDRFCSYCAIPYARGAIRSRPLESVRRELELLDSKGCAEVVLTGIHLMSYGRDFKDGTDILDALDCADGLRNIGRIRLGSLEPHMIDDRIIAGLAENKRLCRHFHVSLQSGSDTVLQRMRRGYTSGEYFELCKKLRMAFGDRTAITTDLIAGFPGETEEEHKQTMDFVRAVGFSKLHVFPYSRRSGTKADAMDYQLQNAEKSRRASELIQLGRILEREYLMSYIGEKVRILVEKNEDGLIRGHTDTYVMVKARADIPVNAFAEIDISQCREEKDGELYLL